MMAMDIFWGFVQQVVTWFLVVMGWLVLSDQAERREVTKSYFGRLQELRKELRSLEELSRGFHAEAYNEVKAQQVARAERHLSLELNNLKAKEIVPFSLTQEVIRLRQALTSRNFDSSSHSVQPWSSEIQLEIASAVDSVDRALFNAAHRIATAPITLRSSVTHAIKNRF